MHYLERDCLESLGKTRNGSRDKVVSGERSNSDHSKTSILKFLHGNIFSLGSIHLAPLLGPVDGGFLIDLTGVGLPVNFRSVLHGLDGTAEDDELGPPLRISLGEGKDGVRGINGSVESSHKLGEQPTNGGQHGRATVGQLSLSKVLNRSPLCQVKGIEDLSGSLGSNSSDSRQVSGQLRRSPGGLRGRSEGRGSGDGSQKAGDLHG
mmetsp:Transcript_25340/g.72980  ORF Transcript_25340/g.72980 Transcript_25340/m.72980 type:complete len:207 (+) Transcript_25340:254-874(+)